MRRRRVPRQSTSHRSRPPYLPVLHQEPKLGDDYLSQALLPLSQKDFILVDQDLFFAWLSVRSRNNLVSVLGIPLANLHFKRSLWIKEMSLVDFCSLRCIYILRIEIDRWSQFINESLHLPQADRVFSVCSFEYMEVSQSHSLVRKENIFKPNVTRN